MIQRIAKETKVHPRTGAPLRPVFVSQRTGRVYWPILGASPDDDSNDDGNSDDASGEGSDGSGDGAGGAGSEDQGGESKDGADGDLKKQVDSLTERMKAADRRAADAEKKLKEIEDAKKDDLTKAQDKVAEHEKTIDTLQNENKSLRLENSFALNNSFTWHDPSVVLDLVRKRDDVTIDDDGNVKGMTEALKAIAKDKPYLVKDGEGGGTLPKSGSPAGQGKNGSDSKALETKARSRFRL